MRTAMQVKYTPLLLKIHPAQVEALDAIKERTGKDRTTLIREAVSLLIGRYELAQKESNNVKVA